MINEVVDLAAIVVGRDVERLFEYHDEAARAVVVLVVVLTSLVVVDDDVNTNADLLAVTVLVIADLVDIAAAVIITKIIVCISDECCDVREFDSITVL